MKKIISITLLLILFLPVFSQEREKFTTVIPKCYAHADNMVLLNSKQDTVMTFHREGRISSIQEKKESFLLEKRKVLLDSDNHVLAFYKRRKIVFPSKNKFVLEKKKRKGWEYFLEGKKVLEVNYVYDKKTKDYSIEILPDDSDEITRSLIKICLGRFDKSVEMDYGHDGDWVAIIVAAIVASVLSV